MTAAQNITQLFTGYKWPTTTITYTFITEYAPYTPQGDQEPGGPIVLSAARNKQRRGNSLLTFKAFLASSSSKSPKTMAKTR